MNLDSLSFALSQISYLVANLTKKNYKSSVAEISHLVAQHGAEADRHLFRCLFSHVDFGGDGKSSGKDFHQTQFLIQECASLTSKPNFISALCYAVDSPLHHQKSLKPTAQLFSQISKVLRLTRVQEVLLGLALLSSQIPETRNYAAQFVKQKLPDLLRSYIDLDTASVQEGGLQDTAVEVVHLLLTQFLQRRDQFGIGTDQKEAFLKALRKDFPVDRVPIVLFPLLYPDKQDPAIPRITLDAVNMPKAMNESSLADMIVEVGYSCTASIEECRTTLVQFGVREITPASIARVLGLMAKTPSGLGDQINVQSINQPGGSIWGESKEKQDNGGLATWNVDVFVQVVQDLAPHLNWKEVVGELDHPGFVILSKQGFRLLVQALFRGIQDIFPVEFIYRHWKNSEGQLSWITQSLKYPDVFCFADYQCHTVVIDILKMPPDDENREIATWKSLDLVETLLRLSEAGHYQLVSELFKFPIQHCPDMLVLALLQIAPQPNWNTLKHELISTLMPTFLGNHQNSAIVLHYAWHCQGQSTTIRTLIMHSMAEWYMRGDHHDQVRLSRILDVAQDLKALSMLLNATPFAFVIDLACLASRREYLKLDKWLGDKIREHGEPFVQSVVNFLKRRCPQVVGGAMKEDPQHPQSKNQLLPADTFNTMLACLQACCSSLVAPELTDAIVTMVANANMMMKQRLPPPGAIGAKPMNQGMGSAINNPMDQLGPNGNFGLGTTMPSSVSAPNMPGFPQSLGPLNTTPGSPAKGLPFPGQSQAQGQAQTSYSMQSLATQSLATQLQGLSMQTTMPMSTPMSRSTASSGTPSLGALSAAAAMKQQQQQQTQQTADRLRQGESGDMSSIFPEMNQQFSKEIEDEANSYFQRIYNHPPHPTISIDEVLDMLKRFKDSSDRKEKVGIKKEVFHCMLRNLFEEYRFFPQYPDKELHTTAVLFGGIIEQGLVTYMSLGIALRFVLEALKKPYGAKMYNFGIAALDRFKTRLKDYPQYCQHLASIPHFNQFPPHLIEYVQCGARSQEPPNRPQGPATPSQSTPSPLPAASTTPVTTSAAAAPSSTTSTQAAISKTIAKPSIANTTNIDTLIAGTEGKEEICVPREAVQDKVFFIFNNLSQSNMAQKSEELKEAMSEEHMPWVSQYLVMKRASIEPNFHTLYANFIDHMHNNWGIIGMVIKETFRNIKVLLRSDKGVANFSDRSLLKNLGHWLGLLTLGKNKPILHIDIDLKSLVYEAYHKGAQELLYVVPFVAKVVESCAKSKVFKPPNPWTMGIMNILYELHQEPDLKLNLKFEIEVLCKALNLDINSLKNPRYLRNRDKLATLEYQLSSRGKIKEPTPTLQEDNQAAAQTAALVAAAAAAATAAGAQQSSLLPPSGLMPPSGTNSFSAGLNASLVASGMAGNIAGNMNLSAGGMMTAITTPTVSTVVSSSGVATTTTSASATAPPQPQFTFMDINTSSFTGLVPHIVINEQIALFQTNPQLKQYVRPAIERSVQDLLPPVVERSIKIALTTCEQIVKKDFALDPEEGRMRMAAHHMVRNMTAGMALITCREPLLISITTNLKTAFLQTFRVGESQNATPPQKEMIEQASQVLATDNTELACAFIQKTAVEKALPEMDKRLATEFELRKHARNEGRRYCDPVVLTYQAERMPEQIRLKVGGVTPQQLAVYEEFGRNIPGFLPTGGASSSDAQHPAFFKQLPPQQQPQQPQAPQSFSTDEITQIYDKIAHDIEQYLLSQYAISQQQSPLLQSLASLLEAVLLARNSREIVTAIALLQKAVEGLLDGISSLTPASDPEAMIRYRDCHLLVLRGLQDQRAYGPQWTNKQVTRCLIECREDFKYNVEAVDVLIRSHLVNMQQYDVHFAQSMDNGLNYMAVAFAMQLVQRFCIDEKHNTQINEADLYNTIETLARIAAHSRQAPDGLTGLIETIRQHNDGGLLDRAPGGPTLHSGISQAREFDDPPGLHEKTEFLLREWVNMYHSPAAGRDSTKAFSAFVGQMHQQGILKSDDLIARFFRLCTEMCVDLCYRALGEQTHSATLIRAKCFHTLDAFVRLIALLVKHSGDAANPVTKINLLNKVGRAAAIVLGIVAGVLLQDHEVRNTEFQQLPYHRIFIMLFIELNAPELVLDSINFQILTAFCNTLHILRPAKAPGFSYAWLELVSHRVFIGRMLAITPAQRGWGMYAQLLIDLFKFLAPFLRNADLTKPTQLLYRGTLRVLLVLLHDFPEFLCDYHYAFCDAIPPNCIQVRNLILSAFPRNMRLPDPFTPNLKVDMLNEITHAPRILTNFTNMIQPPTFKKDLDSYLKTRSPVTFLSDLRSNLQVGSEPGNRYNIQLINALVLYVGTQAIAYIQQKSLTPSMTTIAHSSHMDIFQNLAVDLDSEGRYLFLNAIANQLRYPNSHTHYFSCTLLYLFAEANTEAIQEQITRVLLERLIVNRPHPWGLLITFIELIKNPQFRFWNHEFVHCAPEIETLFESVARSCTKTHRDDVNETHFDVPKI
ncbi:CCR4-NOT transcription complex subunit 1-like isoform X3 [Lineus longissimus]|uniref:CCR4-NOT transcription complex subunit 1-like isoform X3 n=1 Tax=Lineus longissimus TaxID=88925 RepID=UPI00315D25D5